MAFQAAMMGFTFTGGNEQKGQNGGSRHYGRGARRIRSIASADTRRVGLRYPHQQEMPSERVATKSAIARLESGGRPPCVDTLLRIADAIDCEL
jgi:transcriptional regulator with XRE-family HTH domain